MLEYPDFEQNHYSKTAEGVYRKGHDSIRLIKWIRFYDRSYYENTNYYDLMGSIVKFIQS